MIKALFWGFQITLMKVDMNLNTSKCMIISNPKLNNMNASQL